VVWPAKPLGLGFAGLLRPLWAEGATQCRWCLGLRDQHALGCHAHLRVDEPTVLVVPCLAVAGRRGRSGLGAAHRGHPGAAGRRATVDRRVATHSHLPFCSFLNLPVLRAVKLTASGYSLMSSMGCVQDTGKSSPRSMRACLSHGNRPKLPQAVPSAAALLRALMRAFIVSGGSGKGLPFDPVRTLDSPGRGRLAPMTTESGPAGADMLRDPPHRKRGNTVDTTSVP